MLTDEQCFEFSLGLRTFNEMVRAIHEAGQIFALEEAIEARDAQRKQDREEISKNFLIQRRPQ